uniref:Uncharacterized protein n=1 Tax=Chelativorans sp. (strain BNC1) TaxID=266779 RepID=Q11L74_CHESB
MNQRTSSSITRIPAEPLNRLVDAKLSLSWNPIGGWRQQGRRDEPFRNCLESIAAILPSSPFLAAASISRQLEGRGEAPERLGRCRHWHVEWGRNPVQLAAALVAARRLLAEREFA